MLRRTTSMWIVPRRHSADALQFRSSMAIEITLQLLRTGRFSFSAAFIAHAEAVYDDDAIKNDLCAPISTPDVAADWLRNMLSDLRNAKRWAAEKALRYVDRRAHGYQGAGSQIPARHRVPKGIRILERLREARLGEVQRKIPRVRLRKSPNSIDHPIEELRSARRGMVRPGVRSRDVRLVSGMRTKAHVRPV